MSFQVIFSGDSWTLPLGDTDFLTPEEENCLSKDQVWWPVDRQCYKLLNQGPCESREWLVLEREEGRDNVVCKDRACPCDPARPEFCEVSEVTLITADAAHGGAGGGAGQPLPVQSCPGSCPGWCM